MLTPTEADTRVERGMALLDEKRPGWEPDINLDSLDMQKADYCVLGQLYGLYWRGLTDLFGDTETERKFELGFTMHKDECAWDHGHAIDVCPNFQTLTEAWRRAISARRATSN